MPKLYGTGNVVIGSATLETCQYLELREDCIVLGSTVIRCGTQDTAATVFNNLLKILQVEDLTHGTGGAPERWTPTLTETYYYIADETNQQAEVRDTVYVHDSNDRMRVAFGNCFSTRVEAEIFRDSTLDC